MAPLNDILAPPFAVLYLPYENQKSKKYSTFFSEIVRHIEGFLGQRLQTRGNGLRTKVAYSTVKKGRMLFQH